MGDFKKINVKVFGKKNLKSSPDIIYWKKLGVSLTKPILKTFFISPQIKCKYDPITHVLHM